ncbi:hypothetical protein D932_01704 [Enterococcus casseliflavus 14-MB-W-14]|uniref:Uncharacterized protein n=1 Tax=Enterococcus casseliflavus ATCC 12755 TaxID=888066 RepID=F0EJI1_ENTCA|nr:hypothetical protein HMPREF9087_1177 [Enterococcus casseliflavus ATCC 12755]EPH62216.1 hypothetical protein D931_02399 [Enterococcus faecium 13.SD.W.09]EPH64221.1 hypothetical protein D932_01704 [Enterococcus casseliflavus 14-MB-W-14]EPH87629.1 hypothetical protein D922_04167 [Enterococcus faecalis 06-MB-DW-09]
MLLALYGGFLVNYESMESIAFMLKLFFYETIGSIREKWLKNE